MRFDPRGPAAALLALVMLAGAGPGGPPRTLPAYDSEAMRRAFAAEPVRVRQQSLPYLNPDANVSRRERFEATRTVSLTFAVQGDYQNGVLYARAAYELARIDGDKRGMAGSLSNIGAMEKSLGHYNEAASALRRASRLGREIRHTVVVVSALGNLSNLFLDLGDYSHAIEFSREAEAVGQRDPAVGFSPVGFIGRAQAYALLGNADAAHVALERARAGVSQDDKARQGAIALAAALLAQQTGHPAEAVAEGEACAHLVRAADASPRQAVECLAVAGRGYLAQGKLREAAARLAEAKAAFAAATPGDDPAADGERLAIAELERDCAMKQAVQGNLPSLLETIETYRKRIASARSGAEIAVAAADMGQEGRDLSIALLEARNGNLALRAQQQRYLIALAALVAVLAVAAALLFWRAWRERIRLTASLAAALDHQATLTRDIRHRARNNLQLILSLLNLQWRSASEAAGHPEPLPPQWEDLRRRIAAMGLVQSALYDEQDIDAPVLLAPFLARLGQAIATSYGRDEDFVADALAPDIAIPCERAQPLGLLASELLANAFKHGDAGKVELGLQAQAEGALISLTVSDAGPGFLPGAARRGGSGLDLVEHYVDQLHGRTTLASSKAGTAWTVTFPVRAEARRS